MKIDHDRARRLWVRGVRSDDIAAQLGTTANAIRSLAHIKCWPKRHRAHNREVYRPIWAEAEKLWRDKVPAKEIARRLGYKRDSSIRHLAARLGWPKHGPNRDTSKATAAILARSERKAEEMLRMATEYEKRRNRGVYLKNDAPQTNTPQPTPTVFRCPWCNGKASDPEGHSLCITRNTRVA